MSDQVSNFQNNSKIPLNDHAFVLKMKSDPGFRQALVLDTQKTLEPFKISDFACDKLTITLDMLDHLTDILIKEWTHDEYLLKTLSDPKSRRVLLFALKISAPVFSIPDGSIDELINLSDMANALFESILDF